MNFLTIQKLSLGRGRSRKDSSRPKTAANLKKAFLPLFAFLSFASFAQSAKTVTIQGTDLALQKVFTSITKQTGYVFFYNMKILDKAKPVSLNIQKKSVSDALGIVLEGQPFTFNIQDRTIVITLTSQENKSTGSIQVKGRVLNQQKEPYPGINVWVPGTRIAAVTDFDGSFVLSNVPSNAVIECSGLTIETTRLILDGRSEITITAKEKVSLMNEVVVNNGYQKVSKSRSTGAVSVINAETLDKIPVGNVMQQLEGQVAGLAIDIEDSDNSFVYSNLAGSNQGDGSYSFRIRGQSTYNANSMPLVILDGTPTELDIRTLNPKDIEKITFLKDAAAASIYGARSANGVMVIETKRGKKGKTRITASQNYSFTSNPSLSKLPLMNSSQVLNLEQELVDKNMIADPSLAVSLYNSTPISQGVEYMFQQKRGTITGAQKEAQLDVLRGRNSYSQIEKYMLQPAEAQAYNFSISGGENDYSYFTSASFSKENTQASGTGGKRLTLMVNQDFKLFNYLKVNTSLKGSFFNYTKNGLGLSPLSASLVTYLPYDQVVDDQGNSVSYQRRFYGKDEQKLQSQGYLPWTYSYMDELNNADHTLSEQNYSANISVTAPLFKGLDANVSYYVENSNMDDRNFLNSNTYAARDRINYATSINPSTGELTYGIPLGGINQDAKYNKYSYTGRGQLDYNTLIGEKHSIAALGGIEFRELNDKNETGTLFGYNENSQTSIDLPANMYTTVYGGREGISYGNELKDQTRRFLSYYGNASYTYDNKYTISGSARLDDYNNFGVDKRYRRTPLWSTGLKWNIIKENFMKDVTFINNLSFRASYGFNGNISLTTFPFTNISLSDVDTFSQQPYAFVAAAANPALRWEKTGIMNFGLDFSLFNYRLNGTVEYYKKESDDLIQEFKISSFYGLPNSSLSRNTSTLESHGIDLSLNSTVLKGKDFSLDLNLVTSYNTNEVTDSRYTNYSDILNGSGSAAPIAGYSLNSVFAFRNAGLNSTGSVQVYDKDGNIVQSTTVLKNMDDMKYMGTSTPKYYGSLNANLTYKKLSLYVLATYKLDYVLFKPTFDNYISRYNTFAKYDLNSDIDQRWRNPGDEAVTTVPGVKGMSGYSYGRYRFSDNRVIDGDHIRLKEISLKYDLSEFFAGTFIEGASITGSARNIGIIWRKNKDGLDPDFLPATGNVIKLPPMAMYSMGINFNF